MSDEVRRGVVGLEPHPCVLIQFTGARSARGAPRGQMGLR
jgi:hypothetical protein